MEKKGNAGYGSDERGSFPRGGNRRRPAAQRRGGLPCRGHGNAYTGSL